MKNVCIRVCDWRTGENCSPLSTGPRRHVRNAYAYYFRSAHARTPMQRARPSDKYTIGTYQPVGSWQLALARREPNTTAVIVTHVRTTYSTAAPDSGNSISVLNTRRDDVEKRGREHARCGERTFRVRIFRLVGLSSSAFVRKISRFVSNGRAKDECRRSYTKLVRTECVPAVR